MLVVLPFVSNRRAPDELKVTNGACWTLVGPIGHAARWRINILLRGLQWLYDGALPGAVAIAVVKFVSRAGILPQDGRGGLLYVVEDAVFYHLYPTTNRA